MYTLNRPEAAEGAAPEVLQVDALGADVYGVTLGNLTSRGIYTVTAVKGDVSAERKRRGQTVGSESGRQRSGPRVGTGDASIRSR